MERRKFFRIKKEGTLKVVKEERTVKAKIYDLAGEGAGIIAETPLEINEKVKLLFPLHENELSLEGKVVWRKELKEGWRTGINFISPRLFLISYLIKS